MRSLSSMIHGDEVENVTHVVTWVPPALIEGGDSEGYWELQTLADFDAYTPQPSCDWDADFPRDTGPARLADWVAGLLGYPVLLTSSLRVVWPIGMHVPHREPMYYVAPEV